MTSLDAPRTAFCFILLLFILQCGGFCQETVFNVPSADVLDRGKTYAEFDASYRYSGSSAGFTPRIVTGIGKRIEVGLNIGGVGTPATLQTTLTPAAKWKPFASEDNGWSFLVGDNLSIPVQNRTYDLGNYAYAEFVKTWKMRGRLTIGAYHFTPDVVSAGQRAGGQFAFEQSISKRITLASDWYTGDSAVGYFTPGIIIKMTHKLTWYGSYQIGNRGFSNGNHQVLTEFGWNLN